MKLKDAIKNKKFMKKEVQQILNERAYNSKITKIISDLANKLVIEYFEVRNFGKIKSFSTHLAEALQDELEISEYPLD